jgi:hypothetical protein
MTSRPRHRRKIVELTLLAFAPVGVLLLFGLFRSRSDLLASLSTGTGIATLVVYFVVAVVPAGLPAVMAGATHAATLIEREPPGRTFGFWALRGMRVGAILRATNAVVWFALINISISGIMALVGAGAGATVGLVVALYCWRPTPHDRNRSAD